MITSNHTELFFTTEVPTVYQILKYVRIKNNATKLASHGREKPGKYCKILERNKTAISLHTERYRLVGPTRCMDLNIK